jgi:hypothetical protein
MTRSLLIAVLFVGPLLTSPLSARELTVEEKLALTGYEKSKVVMSYMTTEIDPRLMSLTQRIAYQVTRRACQPVEAMINHIESSESLEDQSRALLGMMYACFNGVVNVTDIYREQQSR